MTDYDRAELQRLHDLPLDDLYGELFVQSDAGSGFLGTPGMKVRKGRELYERAVHTVRRVVCDEWKACEKLDSVGDDAIALIAAIAAVISPALPQLPGVVVAAIVVKIGVKVFCATSDQQLGRST